jgi:hypothetical protein
VFTDCLPESLKEQFESDIPLSTGAAKLRGVRMRLADDP